MSGARIETYNPVKVVKEIAPNARFGNGDRMFLPGMMTDCLNARYKNNSSRGISENVPGTLLKTVTLPAGTNRCIGQTVNTKSNTLIYFIWNSNNDDRVIEYDVDTDTPVNLLAGDLGFEVANYIQARVVDDQLIWNDRVKTIQSINIQLAKNAVYTSPYSSDELDLATRPPQDPATFVLGIDAAISINSIIEKTFQFAYRFVYRDNRESTFSPPSSLAWVQLYGKPNTNTNIFTVRVYFPAELAGIVKRIDIAYREGNTGNYFIFEDVKNPVNAQYDVKFTNAGKSIAVSTVDQNRISDAIPPRSDGFEVVENRVFTVLNDVGFNIDDSTFSLQLTLISQPAETPYNTTNKRLPKMGGIYNVGIICEDGKGRTSFVKGNKTISIPHSNIGNPAGRYRIRWTLTGTPPAGMKKYRIVISQNNFQTLYFQCKAIPHFYLSELPAGGIPNAITTAGYSTTDKLFETMTDDGAVAPNGKIQNIYLQIPLNVPVVPDATYIVKLPDGFPGGVYQPVLQVIGDFLVIPYTNYAFWKTYLDTKFSGGENQFYIEVFKKREGTDQKYYEIPQTFNIIDDDFTVFSGDIFFGDTFNLQFGEVDKPGAQFTDYFFYANVGTPSIVQTMMSKNMGVSSYIESPSAVLLGIKTETIAIEQTSKPGESFTFTQTSVTKTAFSFDYNKISNDFGRVHTVYSDEKKNDFFSTLGFSNPYVQGSQINGLNTFLAANNYPLAIERGPISGLIRSQNVLLAIHEQTTSSLYIGEGIMKTGKDFIVTKTDDVVGDDHNLEYGYGTINPESIIRVFSYVFWWDAYKGAVVQYTQAGLDNVAKTDMRSYFYKKSRDYFPYRHDVKIVTGFDHSTDELIISFPEVKNGETVVIAAETWAYNLVDKDWSTRYSFFVENYAAIGQQLFSFKNGQLWHHNQAAVPYNNFHGVQYTRKMRFVSNQWPGKNKRYLNAHVEGSLCVNPLNDSYKVIKFYSPAGQESFTPATEFEQDEGFWSGPILKDIHTPGDFTGRLALQSGDDIVGRHIEFEIENDTLDKGRCGYVNIVFKLEEFST